MRLQDFPHPECGQHKPTDWRKIVQVIYATGQPGHREFAVAEQRRAVPAGVIVFAICDGDCVEPQVDERFFASISEEEYDHYMALLRDAVEREKLRLRDPNAATKVRRFFNWI